MPSGGGNATGSGSESGSTWVGFPSRKTHAGRGVIVERSFQRIDQLVVEGRLRTLRQPTDEELDRFRVSNAANSLRGKNVGDAWSQAAVGDHRHTLGARLRIELLLLEHDVGVAAQVGGMDAELERQPGDGEVEVVGQRAQDHVMPA